jgi:hypothetical protein
MLEEGEARMRRTETTVAIVTFAGMAGLVIWLA